MGGFDMSLKPPKKSEINKGWLDGRYKGKKKKMQPEYHLIITEGTKTEPNYFKAIKNLINKNYSTKIQLEIVGQGDNTTNLFDEAKKLVKGNPNGYKHVWIIYDTDEFPQDKINEVPDSCKKESSNECEYHAIWSNQCIELWFLLHFSFMHSDLHRNEYQDKLSEQLNMLEVGPYTKTRDDMFDVLKDYTDTAIANAKKLEKINSGKTPSKSAPGTKVYKLIEKLKHYW